MRSTPCELLWETAINAFAEGCDFEFEGMARPYQIPKACAKALLMSDMIH